MLQEISTSNSLTYKFFPLMRGSLRFVVKAKDNAHIALTTSPLNDSPIYEIFIGGWVNSKSGIRRDKKDEDTVKVDTPDIISNEKTKEFWIKWFDGSLMVGQAGESHPFLTYWDASPFPISYYGVRTGCGSTGEWLIEGGRSVSTPDELKYNFWPLPSGELGIDVQCASNAHIALISSQKTAEFEDSPRIEMILGGWENTLSIIRRDGVELPRVSAATPGIVSDAQFRHFRIKWKNGSLLVFSGKEKSEPILEYHDPDHLGVSHYGVRTTMGATGKWRIHEGEDPEFDDGSEHSGHEWIISPSIPPNAVCGGEDAESLQYVGRTRYQGALLPGRISPKHQLCYVTWNSQIHTSTNYQVLCGTDVQWIPIKGKNIPPDAVIGGQTGCGETLYIGRAHHERTVTVGKVQRSKGVCYICFKETELAFKNYEILVTKAN